jgi:hypothetical protein
MTVRNSIVSISLLDADGRTASLPIYATFNDAAVTLADLISNCTAIASEVDAITDAQPVGISLTLEIAPTGVKAEPVALSDVEEGGLFSFMLTSPEGKSYGMWIPGIMQSLVSLDVIPNAGDVITFTATMLSPAGTMQYTNDLWSSTFASLKGNAGRQRFRKTGKR